MNESTSSSFALIIQSFSCSLCDQLNSFLKSKNCKWTLRVCTGILLLPKTYPNQTRYQTCVVRGVGQLAKLLAARAEFRLTRAFGSGTIRQGSRGRRSRESDLEATVKKQQGKRMKHENGEGEMERYDMRTANTLSHACTRCLYSTQRKCVRKMCVRHGMCVQDRAGTFRMKLPSACENVTDAEVSDETFAQARGCKGMSGA